jgi:hypothetical protein
MGIGLDPVPRLPDCFPGSIPPDTGRISNEVAVQLQCNLDAAGIAVDGHGEAGQCNYDATTVQFQ